MPMTFSIADSRFTVAEARIHTKPLPMRLYSSAYFKIYPRLTEPTAKQKVILLRVVEDELNMAAARDLIEF